MERRKRIKAEEIVSVPKQQLAIMAKYKPIPKFGAGCKSC